MRFGCFMSPLHPVGENPALLFQRDLELARFADSLDYDEMWVGEHHSAGWGTIASPELFIAAAAERTRRITFATGVAALPYHHPFLVADRAVQLDHMTRGRFILGCGAGSVVSDMHMFGISPDETRPRVAQSLETILALLRGETVTRDEGWFTLRDARLQLLPYRPQGLEVAVTSAATPFGVQLAGRLGINVLSYVAPPWGAVRAGHPLGVEKLAGQWELAREAAEQAGRTIDRSNWRIVVPVHVAETREQACEEIWPGWRHQRDELWGETQGIPLSRAELSARKAFEHTVEQGGILAGSAQDVIAGIEKLGELTGGFGTLLISCQDWAPYEAQQRSLSLFARHVTPHFTGSVAPLRASNTWVRAHRAEFQEAGFAARDKAMNEAAKA